jgi:hypothetical protein
MPRRNLLVAAGAALAIVVVLTVVLLGRQGETGSTAKFCDTLRSGDDPLAVFDRYDPSNPDAAGVTLRQGADRLRELERAAPGEVKGSMSTLVRVADELVKVVGATASSSASTASTTPSTHDFQADFASVEQASATVVSFAQGSCGVSLGGSTVTAATVPAGTPSS